MKRYRVLIPRTVKQQIAEQLPFIARDSVDNALAWEERLRAAIEAIGDAPGHAVDEDASARLGYTVRKCVFENTYLIHYRVDAPAGAVSVVNFRHGTRLPHRGEP